MAQKICFRNKFGYCKYQRSNISPKWLKKYVSEINLDFVNIVKIVVSDITTKHVKIVNVKSTAVKKDILETASTLETMGTANLTPFVNINIKNKFISQKTVTK